MGIYAITGASSGIGAKTKELLEADGNRVINIDLKGGDICVNLASEAGRQKAIDELNGVEYDQKVISVSVARPRTERPSNGGGRGGYNNSRRY